MVGSKKLYLRTGDTQAIYLKSAITSPDIVVDDYTIYNDFADNLIKFEQNNVPYHCPISHGRLLTRKFCSIACGAKFLSNSVNRTMNSLPTCPFPLLFEEWELERKDVAKSWNNEGDTTIGNDIWIGYEAVILAGVTIGNGAIIGARTIVTKDVPPYTIVGGVPTKLIKERSGNKIIPGLLNIQWWD